MDRVEQMFLLDLSFKRMLNPLRGSFGVSFCFIGMIMEKEFKSYSEQIRILKNKGLIIDNTEHAKCSLKHIGYFALINGYKRPFKQSDGRYIQETKFEDIEQLFEFDDNLRTLMLEHLLLIERRIKSSIAYNFSSDYKGKNEYFNVNNYDYNNQNISNTQEINKLVAVMLSIYNDNKHPYIMHYKYNHHGDIPLWVIINAMTFGQVSKMYALLKMGTKQRISGDFNIASHKDLEKMLNMITLFRNVCAHNERLYDFKVQSGVDIKYIKPYVQTNNNTYERERKRFFGLLVCCKQLVKGHEGQKFSHDLIKLINEAPITNNTNVKNIILTEMGLPNNWKDFLEQG